MNRELWILCVCLFLMKPKSCPLSLGTNDPTNDGIFCRNVGDHPRVVSQNFPSPLLFHNVLLAFQCSYCMQLTNVLSPHGGNYKDWMKLCLSTDVSGSCSQYLIEDAISYHQYTTQINVHQINPCFWKTCQWCLTKKWLRILTVACLFVKTRKQGQKLVKKTQWFNVSKVLSEVK